MKHKYICEGTFEFQSESNSPGTLREKLIRIIKREGFSEVGFELHIARLLPQDQPKIESPPIKIIQPVTKKRKVRKVKRKRSK